LGHRGISRPSLLLALLLVLLILIGAYAYFYNEPEEVTVTSIVTVFPSQQPSGSPSPPVTAGGTTTRTTVTTTMTVTATQSTAPTEPSPTSPSTQPSTFTWASPSTTSTTTSPTGPEEATLISPSKIWLSIGGPNKLLQYDFTSKSLTPVFGSHRRISSFTPHPAIREKVFYLDANTKKIILHLLSGHQETVVFEHNTYVRCVRFGPEDRLYFSEAFGAGSDGKIYRIVNNRAELYVEVPLSQVGYWSGYFEFTPEGLYISSGNKASASIYQYSGGRFVEIARFNSPVMGMDYVTGARLRTQSGEVTVERGLLFADDINSIYLYDLGTGDLYLVFRDESLHFVYDVSVAP